MEGLLPKPCAVQHGQTLFKHLKQKCSAKEQPVLHAQVLLLQSRLPGLLAVSDKPIALIQQATELLTDAKVTTPALSLFARYSCYENAGLVSHLDVPMLLACLLQPHDQPCKCTKQHSMSILCHQLARTQTNTGIV